MTLIEVPETGVGAGPRLGLDRAVAAERRVEAVQDRVSELAGVLHATAGAVVDVVADALAEGLWNQWGVHSPAQWLAWKTGLSKGRAQMFVRVARRRHELPATVAALRSGVLSIDSAQLIALHVPARFDEAAVELARHTTVAQLARVLPRYAWEDDDLPDDDLPGDPPGVDGPPGVDPEDEPLGSVGSEERRRGWFGWDETGESGRLSASLPIDEAMTLETALKAARAELLSRHRTDNPGAGVRWFDDADALMELARSYLTRGTLDRPGSDRFLVHAHLDQHPDGAPVLRSHLGPIVPDALRRFLTCDCDLRPVFKTNGVALSVGRTQRLVPDRARKLIEQRDQRCVIPGCGRTGGLDIHHIIHWEHGGPTDTANLCCLCRTHHRQHHLGLLGITGNADHPDGLTITDRWNHPMPPAATPVPVNPTQPPETAATTINIPVHTHQPATGERLHTKDIWLTPNPTRGP